MMQLFVHEQLGQSHRLILSWRILTCPYILFIIMQGMYRPQNDLLDHLLLLLPGILTVDSLSVLLLCSWLPSHAALEMDSQVLICSLVTLHPILASFMPSL